MVAAAFCVARAAVKLQTLLRPNLTDTVRCDCSSVSFATLEAMYRAASTRVPELEVPTWTQWLLHVRTGKHPRARPYPFGETAFQTNEPFRVDGFGPADLRIVSSALKHSVHSPPHQAIQIPRHLKDNERCLSVRYNYNTQT